MIYFMLSFKNTIEPYSAVFESRLLLPEDCFEMHESLL